ncbi:MAG: sodium:alanine symporter family protein [Clostridia bacterium]|nr:sodium:alanine symporter family protein [Clostridia bacterium]
MGKILEIVEKVNAAVNGVVWGWPMIILILGTGILLTVRTKFLQVRKFGAAWNETIISTVKDMGKKKEKTVGGGLEKKNAISPFEAFATAISGTVGTGNIIGVTSAIMTGGPGAVFWMWVSAFFGMVTNYAENVLGVYFRKKDEKGEYSGGPMYYLSEGLGKNASGKAGAFWKTFGKILGVAAAVFCAFAAIGMSGVQTNKISNTFQSVFSGANDTVVGVVVGVILAIILALIILGGIKSIGRVASILVPFMSIIFIVVAIVVILTNITSVGVAFGLIFKNIVSLPAVAGGVGGFVISEFARVIQKGLARGVFSNEAGLGSSVIAYSASDNPEPVKQGLWGVFGVFFDTFIICTLTAIVVLVSTDTSTIYATDATGALIYTDTQISMGAFATFIPSVAAVGRTIYAVAVPLFAFTTILAWAYYGEKCVDFLFIKTGKKGRKIATMTFKIAYVLLVVVSALIDGELAWSIADTFNGLMALPNLIGLVLMSGLVVKITKNYFARKKGENILPMLSAYETQNEELKAELAAGITPNEAESETAKAQETEIQE